mgnify:CR=1 FL=1
MIRKLILESVSHVDLLCVRGVSQEYADLARRTAASKLLSRPHPLAHVEE